MKSKISITISQDVLKAVDRRAKKSRANRSAFIEAALRRHIARIIREERDAKDVEIINANAAFLNKEAADVLAYQVPIRHK